MNLRRLLTSIVVLLLVAVIGGCGSAEQRQGNAVVTARPPKQPPPVPPRRDVALDPVLVQSAREEILATATSADPILRARAIEAMKEGMGREAAPQIVAALGDPEPVVRFAATLAAGEMRLREAREMLLRLVNDQDPSVRVGVRFALHRLGDTRLSSDLQTTFSQDPDEGVRADTALVLGLLGNRTAETVLSPMLNDRSPIVRLRAAEALWRLQYERGVETLVVFTVSRYPDDQIDALLGLAAPRDRRVISHLRGALTTDYEEVNLVAARSMGMIGSDEGYGVALKGAGSKDPLQRVLAAMALGAIGRADAQEVLAPMLRDSDSTVRIAAAMAILQLR